MTDTAAPEKGPDELTGGDASVGKTASPTPASDNLLNAANSKPGDATTNVQDSKPPETNTNDAATAADKLSNDAATKQPGADAPKPVVDTPETAGGKTAMEQANPKPPTDLTGKGTDAAQQAKSLEAQNGNPNLTPKPLDTTNGRVNGSLYYDESGAAKYKVGNQVYNYSEKDGKVTLTPPEGATYRGYEGTAAVTKLNQTTVITEKAPVAEQAKAPDNTSNIVTDKTPAAADPNAAKVVNQPLHNAGSDQIGNATKGAAPVAETVKPIEQPIAKPQDGIKVGQDSPLDANAGKVTQPVANAPIPQANPVAQTNPITPGRQTGTDTSTIRQTTPDNNVLYDRLGYKAPEAGTNIKVPEKVPDTTYKTPDVPQANQGGTNIQPYSNLGNTGKVSDGSHGAGSKSDNISSNLNTGKLDSSLNTGSGTSKDIVNRTTDNVIKTPEVIKDVSSGIGKNIDAATRGNDAIRNANETAADRVNQALGIKPGDAPNLQGGSILATDKTAIRVGDALKAGQAIVTADGKVLVVDKNGNLSVPEGALGKAGNVLGKGGEALDKAGGLLGKQLDLKVGPNGTVVDKNGNVIGKLADGLPLTPGKLGEGVGKAVDAAGNAIKIGPDGKPILDKLTTDGKLASDGKGLSLDKAGDKLAVGKDGLSTGLGKEGGLLGTVKGGLETGGTLSKEGLKGEKGITSADALGKTGTDAAGRAGTEKGTVALDATGKPIATNLTGQSEALSAGKGGEKGTLGAKDLAAGQTTDGTTQANIAGKQQISSQQATTDALVAKATAANDGSITGQKQELSAKEQQANKLDALTQRQQELEQSGKRVEKVDPAAAGARVGELGQREITKEQIAQLKEEQKLLEELKAKKKEEGKEKGEEQTEQQRLAALALLAAADRKLREKEDLDKKEKEQLAEKDKKEEDSRRERYVVRDGDTLESIAAKRLRDKYLSALIFEINRNIIPVVEKDGKKIAQLKAKMVIYLPSQLDIKNYRARLFSKGTNVDLTAKSGTIGLQDKDVLGENEGSEKRAMDNDEGSTSAEADASAIGSDVLYPDQVDMVNKASQEGIKPTHDGIEPTNVDISSGESSIDDMERQAMLGAEARRANVERLLGPLAKDKAAAKSDTGRLKHTVRLGETLRSLAFSKFNDVKLWRLIAEVNNIATTLDSKGDPVNNQLKRGTSIELPTELEIVRYREAGFAHPSVNLNNLKENKDGLSRQQESIIAEAHQQVSKILSKHADSNDTVQTTNKECPSCQRLVPALAEMCSACLHVFDASSTQAQNHPSTVQAKEQPGSESAVKNLLGSLASSSAGYSTEKGPGDAEEVTDKVLKATGFSNEDKPVNSNRSTTLLSDTSTSKAQQTTEPTVALDIETQTLLSPYEKFTTYNFSEDIRLLKFNYQRENGEQAHLAGLEVMHNGQWLRVMEYDMAQSGSYWKEYKLSGGGRMPTELNLPVKNVLEMVDTNLFINWRQYCTRFLAGRRIMD